MYIYQCDSNKSTGLEYFRLKLWNLRGKRRNAEKRMSPYAMKIKSTVRELLKKITRSRSCKKSL